MRLKEKMLDKIDILVYDIQDVGSRYYTYLYTLAYSIQSCSKYGKKIIVLDRPNPISCNNIEGFQIDDNFKSFGGGYRLPNRYGFTIGEYAMYLKDEFSI